MNENIKNVINAFVTVGVGSMTNLGMFFYYVSQGADVVQSLVVSGAFGSAAAAIFLLAITRQDN